MLLRMPRGEQKKLGDDSLLCRPNIDMALIADPQQMRRKCY